MKRFLLVSMVFVLLVLLVVPTAGAQSAITPELCTKLFDYNAKSAHHTWSPVADRIVSVALSSGSYAYGMPRYGNIVELMYFGDLIAWAYIPECGRWAISIWRAGVWRTHFIPEAGMSYINGQVQALNNVRYRLMTSTKAILQTAGAWGFAIRVPVKRVAVGAASAASQAAQRSNPTVPLIIILEKFCVVRIQGKCAVFSDGSVGVEMH